VSWRLEPLFARYCTPAEDQLVDTKSLAKAARVGRAAAGTEGQAPRRAAK